MVSKEEILLLTNRGIDVFHHYLPGSWRIGRNFLNPLYEDKKASCNIYFDRRNNCYRLKDFGNDDYSGDCFFLVGKLKGLDCQNPNEFITIMESIYSDMNLFGRTDNACPALPEKPMNSIPKKNKPYSIIPKPFSPEELKFWGKYGITSEVLKNYRVVSLKEFQSENSEGKPFCFSSNEVEPLFGYEGGHFIKIYRPGSEIRFLYGGNLDDNYCFGLEQLPAKGDVLFITGGEKDVMSLATRGYNAICFNSETANIPKSVIHKLSYMFKHIVLLYDMDKTGQESSLKQEGLLAEFDVKRLLLPLPGTKEAKDVSDYFLHGNTNTDFRRLFLSLLETLYSNTMAILKSCEIDFTNPPPLAQMIISAGDVPLGTQGNLLCITGGEGTGKSNYVCSLVAGAIRNDNTGIDTLGVTVCANTRNKAVLLYDTEQSEVQLYKNISNILRRSKQDRMPDYFKAYCLTSMSRKERLQSIIQSIDKFHYQYGGIQMVVIDGIADLIRCANDEAESIAIVDELYRLAGIYKTCIVCVLHFVPNGLKLRGHLGSELQRKAAAILSIERDSGESLPPDVSVVKALKVRDGSPFDVPLMQFVWDKVAGMHLYYGEKPREEKEKRKENELANVARDIFSRQRCVTYIDLCEQLQDLLDVKERTAKSYIKFMREKDIIIKDSENASYYNLKQ